MGRWHISDPEPDLFHFLEAAKLNLLDSGSREEAKRRLTFDASYKEGAILISIPVRRINLEDRNGQFTSEIKIEVNVYRNHKKIEHFEQSKLFQWTEEQILEKEKVA